MPPIPKPDIGDIDVEGKEGKSRWSFVSKTPLELDPRLLLLLVRPNPVFIGKSIVAMFITGIWLVFIVCRDRLNRRRFFLFFPRSHVFFYDFFNF